MHSLAVGLQLTLYGTGLVFLVLAFLWGVMWALLRLDSGEGFSTEKEAVLEPQEEAKAEPILPPEEQVAIVMAVLTHMRQRSEGARGTSREKSVGRMPASWEMAGRLRQMRLWRTRRPEGPR